MHIILANTYMHVENWYIYTHHVSTRIWKTGICIAEND